MFICALSLVTSIVATQATQTGPSPAMPDDDRAAVDRYLGAGVVGAAVQAPTLGDPASYFDMKDGMTLVFASTVDTDKGARTTETFTVFERDGEHRWKLDTGIGKVLYGALDGDGEMACHSTANAKLGVISRYTPPEPIVVRGMKPGSSRSATIDVEVFDLSAPSKEKDSGSLEVKLTYIGAYEVKVPAGSYEAVLLKWTYEGKVGPAKIRDRQYMFLAPRVGPVAKIERTDISAMLLYDSHVKRARVLVSRTPVGDGQE